MKAATLLTLILILDDKIVDVVCPVDGFKFKATLVGYHPPWGGIDRDFCAQAVRHVPLDLKVWVCPSCYFTGFKSDFDEKLPVEAIKAISGNLKPVSEIQKKAAQEKISAACRFDLLAQTRTIRGAKPEEIGKAYLSGSWVVRQKGAFFPAGFEEFEELYSRRGLAKSPLDMKNQNKSEVDLKAAAKLEAELKTKPPAGLSLMLSRYLALYLYRRHGENVKALEWIKILEETKGENSVIDQGVRLARESIEEERRFQRRALEQFKKAAGLADKAQAEIEYMIGELHRRLGENEPASEWYQKAIDREGKEELKEIVKLAREQKALLGK
jgi:uncharacterized protein (DUF2225 family)